MHYYNAIVNLKLIIAYTVCTESDNLNICYCYHWKWRYTTNHIWEIEVVYPLAYVPPGSKFGSEEHCTASMSASPASLSAIRSWY